MDKILDDVRDYIYSKKGGVDQSHNLARQLYLKFTETETPEQCDRVVMTKEHFLKLVKHIVGERHSSREIEQVYR